jgi:dihydrofolate reductase
MLAMRGEYSTKDVDIAFETSSGDRLVNRERPCRKSQDYGGGVETVRQYLRAGLIDELHFAFSPVVLGQGEAMFAGIDLLALGYRNTEHQATGHASHIVLSR